MTRNWREWLSS